MSCKTNTSQSSSSKNKHYTPMERKVFLQLLDSFKHVIEIKKSDTNTLKDKEVAWKEICTSYNQSALISQERTVQQLKKLWTNIKQTQRDAMTKERQARMATGGGPEQSEANVDPDVALIAPHLMKRAPVAFTSNMMDKEITEKRNFVFEAVSTNKIEALDDEADPIIIQGPIIIQDSPIQDAEHCSDEEPDKVYENKAPEELYPINNNKSKTTRASKGKKIEITESNAEEILRIERIKQIMQQEQHLANIKFKHEQNMAEMREEHQKEFNYLQIKHLKEVHEEEIKIKKAKLKNIQDEYEKENIDPYI